MHTHTHAIVHAQLGSELALQRELSNKQQEQTSRVRQLDMLRGSRGTHEQNRDRALGDLRVRCIMQFVCVRDHVCVPRGTHEQNRDPALGDLRVRCMCEGM